MGSIGMPFIVVEEDPFVRADICEALAEEFPVEDVAVFENADQLLAQNKSFGGDSILIFSTDRSGGLPSMPEPFSDMRTVFIVDHTDLLVPAPDRKTYLQRPFSSATLVAAIRTVHSGQRAHPS